jgi:hypothetical protein
MRKTRHKLAGVAAAAALAATGFGGVSSAEAAVRQFEGTVVSVNRDARTFRLRDTERGTVRIKVTSSTRFERIAGFGALKEGMKRIESRVRKSGGSWTAIDVERSGGGGRHGGDDDGADDNGGGRHSGDDDSGRNRGEDDGGGRHSGDDDS